MKRWIKQYAKYRRIKRRIWDQMSYHVGMNHWRAAENLCHRLIRLELMWDGIYEGSPQYWHNTHQREVTKLSKESGWVSTH